MQNNELGARLKAARRRAGMSQAALATAMGIGHRRKIWQIETGQRQIKAAELVAAATALGQSLENLTNPFRLGADARFTWRLK